MIKGDVGIMKRLVVGIALVLLLMPACQSKNNYLTGESQHWSGKMKVEEVDSSEQINFALKFKGEEEPDQGKVSFSVDYYAGKIGRVDVSGDEDESSNGSECRECLSYPEDDKITVFIKWGDKAEQFDLK